MAFADHHPAINAETRMTIRKMVRLILLLVSLCMKGKSE